MGEEVAATYEGGEEDGARRRWRDREATATNGREGAERSGAARRCEKETVEVGWVAYL